MRHGKKKEIKIKTKSNIKTRTLIIWAVVLCILAPIIIYGGKLVYTLYFSKTPTFVTSPENDPANRPADIPDPETSGIENIVLFGVDDRTESYHGRTDSIIIATIDKGSKVVKLTSIMRDLYVEMGNSSSMDRINAAYAYGGPELALKTLNKNFGLDLKYYAIIDFRGFQELVDKVGGIDIDVKDYEVQEINKYIREVNGKNSTLLTKAGFQHLNGQQALSYARIRYVGDGDFERTERQRRVLNCLFDEAKQISILQIPDMITTLASYVQTNMPLSKVVNLGLAAYKFDGGMQQMRIPVQGYFEGQLVHGNAVLVPDIKANAMFLKEFIYNVKVADNKDVPSYMQNNFHLDDGTVVSSKPKPNIPDYRTPEVPPKSEDEQEQMPIVQPGDNTQTNQDNGTGTDTGSGNGDNTGTDTGNGTGTDTGNETGTNTGGDSGTGTGTDPGDGNGTGSGDVPATP